MASKVQIWNMALGHLGHGKQVTSVDERSPEALACKLFWDQVVDEALGDYPWTFTRKVAALALVEEFTRETDEWSYSYRVPSDCLGVRRILSGIRNDDNLTVVPFVTGQDDQGGLIYTDMEDAEIEYTYRVDDPNRFPAKFAQALALLLAVYISPRVTSGDRSGLREQAAQLYASTLARAQSNDSAQSRQDLPPDAESVRARA